jgi:hypothetical protein
VSNKPYGLSEIIAKTSIRDSALYAIVSPVSQQETLTINLGMSETGLERRRLWQAEATRRGYGSLSAYIMDCVDKETKVVLPKSRSSRPLA